ncbi:jg22450 [Pararge aegeria aegeria]|uniref:BRISC and BRCA1-A complex member 1 n=1 Tax=Pararge aegeria aegeria TaxID=348720 RepID=A0A8S4RTT7_9NEOP|nr:jg22450 [Pararge aegeria aegeria]
MDSPDIFASQETKEPCSPAKPKNTLSDDYENLQEQLIANFQKPNLPNVNVPERIIICLDVCYEDKNSIFRLNDGTTYTRINMLKRVLDFFIYSKQAINKKTEFALLVLKDSEPSFVLKFTNNVKDILNAVDYVNNEDSTSERFDFQKIFELLKQEVEIPEYKQSESILPPPYVVCTLIAERNSNVEPFTNLMQIG